MVHHGVAARARWVGSVALAPGRPAVRAAGELRRRLPEQLATVAGSPLALVAHFPLPDEAWWDDFYAPMERRIEELRGSSAGDAEALAALDQLAQEPAMHRRYSDYYGYEFVVAPRP